MTDIKEMVGRPIVWFDCCATDECMRPAKHRLERDGIGSDYCQECWDKIASLPTQESEDGR